MTRPPLKEGMLDPVPGLFVHVQGTGPRCFVGLHGWSGSHQTFAPVWPHLPKDATLLSFDLPGFGQSAPPAAWTYEAFLAPIRQALDALELERFTLVGNCAGAVVAMELGLARPEGIEHMVLIDPFAYVPWYFALLTAPWLGPLFYYSTFANPIGRFITNIALASKRKKETDMTEGFDEVSHRETYRFLRLLCTHSNAHRYAPLAMPKTILYGKKTFAAVHRSVEIFSDIWTNVDTAALEGAGHLPIQEAAVGLSQRTFHPLAHGPMESSA